MDAARGSRLGRNFVKVVRANVLAQLVLVAALPLLTRLYTPDAFGLAAVFGVGLQVVAAVATLRYERVVPNAGSRRSAALAVAAGAAFLVATSASLALLLASGAPGFDAWDGAARLGPLIHWLPVAVIGFGAHQLLAAWSVREGDMTPVSRARICQSLGYVGVALACAGVGLDNAGLVLAATLAWLASWLPFLTELPRLGARLHGLTLGRARRFVRLSVKTSAGITLVGLVNTVSLAAPVVLLAQLFTVAEVGLYSVMMRLVGTPLAAVTGAMSLSFWSHTAELARAGRFEEIRASFLATTRMLVVPAVGVLAACLLLPLLIPLVLGEAWRAAGPVLVALAPMLIGGALFSPTNHLVVLGRERLQLLADGVRLGAMVALIGFAARLELTFVQTVLGLSLASLLGHLVLFGVQWRVHRLS